MVPTERIIELAKECSRGETELSRELAERIAAVGEFDETAVISVLNSSKVLRKDGCFERTAESVERAIDRVCALIADKAKYDAMTDDEFRWALDELLPSAEMREHLMKNRPSFADFNDLVLSAVVPLEVKLKYASTKDRREIQRAIDAQTAKDGDVFYLFDAWYDPLVGEKKHMGIRPFATMEKALSYVRNETKALKGWDEYYDKQWYAVEKWTKTGDGCFADYSLEFTYFIIDGEVVFFNTEKDGRLNSDLHGLYGGGRRLDLSVPFEVGDILTVDCRPFAPPVHAVLLEKGDRRDCCSRSILYRDPYTRKWGTCGLRYGILIEGIETCEPAPLSPLLRISRYDGELKESERILADVKAHLGGDDGRGRALWEELNTCTDKHEGDRELAALVAKIGAANEEAEHLVRERGIPPEAYDFDDDSGSDGSEFEDGELPF